MNMLLQFFMFYIFCFLSGRSLYIILGNFNSEQVEDEEVFNLKSSNSITNYPGPKYKKVSFSNSGHAFNLADRLNKQFNCNKFTVVRLIQGEIVTRNDGN